jgi:hypothetical protein
MLDDPSVGMTGGQVVPVNGEQRFIGRCVHTLWRLHHVIALKTPKMGEMVAFRNLVSRIPDKTAVDEVSIETDIQQQGYSLAYVPQAIIRNKGPETVGDFLRQRRRIHAGHLNARRLTGYAPSTMSLSRVGKVLVSDVLSQPERFSADVGAAALEATGRLLGTYDHYVAGRSHTVWEIAVTTKDVKGHQ